jgi:protein O-mannosyl-transferase
VCDRRALRPGRFCYSSALVVKSPAKKSSLAPRAPRFSALPPIRLVAAVFLSALIAGVTLYSPALHGPFVLDDLTLPFNRLSIAGVRPVLMFSYWLNYQLCGDGPFSMHVVNLLIHVTNTTLVFLILSRLLAMAGWASSRATYGAVAGAVVFLVHPLQTESVSYIAGRSESLASMFVLLAYAVFLYRRQESISWTEALMVLVLFVLGVAAKENVISLGGILILTDLYWPRAFSIHGLKKNRRLYLPMAPAALAAVIVVFRMLATAKTAGFAGARFHWYQYAFTEARALFTYVRLAIVPLGQSIDHDFPASLTVTAYGAVSYIVLLAILVSAAVVLRRRYPLFGFGLLTFLIWLAPTSSVVPIDDPLVERRMYLAIIGLILIGCEVASRLPFSHLAGKSILAAIMVVFSVLCYQRNELWGQPDQLLAAAAMQSIHNPRPLLNFTEALIRQNRCDLAIPYLERAERALPGNYYVHAAWGRTLACLGRGQEAIERLQQAARIDPTSQVYEWMGLAYGQMGQSVEAGQALQKAVQLNPNSASAHASLGLWYEKVNNPAAAEREYRQSLSLDRTDSWALSGYMRVHRGSGELAP